MIMPNTFKKKRKKRSRVKYDETNFIQDNEDTKAF